MQSCFPDVAYNMLDKPPSELKTGLYIFMTKQRANIFHSPLMMASRTQISILECIKKTPHSPQAVVIRNRVEKHWTHLLRCMALQGLNIEKNQSMPPNPKDNRFWHLRPCYTRILVTIKYHSFFSSLQQYLH